MGEPRPRTEVFLNLPYDPDFENQFLSYICAIHSFGMVPPVTLEIPGGTRRLDRIFALIQSCEFSVHDLKPDTVPEEDAELVLTLMQDHSSDVIAYVPTLIRDFPGLAKRIYHFCANVDDKNEIADAIQNYLDAGTQITEYQLFWFGMMVEDYLLKTSRAGTLVMSLYEHENATDISRAKILEIPDKRFGLVDLREEQLRSGHSDWLAWAAAIGSRVQSKGQRNHLLKYFRKSSKMNRIIGEFVETAF